MSENDDACRGCIANGWEEDCSHSPEYFSVAEALAAAVHGDAATDETAGWFTDDAEQVAGTLLGLLDGQPPTARGLGHAPDDPDRFAVLFNDRYVVTILGTSDGSGETITELVADLEGGAR